MSSENHWCCDGLVYTKVINTGSPGILLFLSPRISLSLVSIIYIYIFVIIVVYIYLDRGVQFDVAIGVGMRRMTDH